MKHIYSTIIISFGFFVAVGQSSFDRKTEEKLIRNVMHQQELAWNKGDLEAFMKTYWKSDSLQFIGKEITQGWNATLERYRKSYPTNEKMGQLNFTLYDFKFIGTDACLVTGRYHLKRISDEPTGMFTLLLRKIKGEWLIVYDHSS